MIDILFENIIAQKFLNQVDEERNIYKVLENIIYHCVLPDNIPIIYGHYDTINTHKE